MDKSTAIPHGTQGGYTNHKCRCDACREAQREYDRAYYRANREKVIERSKAHYEANREAKIEYVKTYSAQNADAVAGYKRKWAEANAEAAAEAIRRWSKEHPQAVRAMWQRRKARRLSADHGCVTAETLRKLWDAADSACVYCGAEAEHADHVHPLSKGGLHCVENLVPACQKCNLRKGSKILDDKDLPAILLSCPLLAIEMAAEESPV